MQGRRQSAGLAAYEGRTEKKSGISSYEQRKRRLKRPAPGRGYRPRPIFSTRACRSCASRVST